MTDLVRINSDNGVGLPVTLADGSRYIIPAVVLITPTGALPAADASGNTSTELDTNGNIVPTYKGHFYTYDDSGNLSTDTVSDAGNTWVKTYTYTPSGPASDSGWVKQ